MLFRSHMSALNDPKIQELMQQNPMAQALHQAMMAHINEHLGFEYRKQIEMQLGFSLPPQHDESGEEVNMDPEVEARLAPMLAQAAQQLLQQNQAQVAQQQAQQQAQDPVIQMQQQELQLKGQEVQRKASKDAADINLKQQQQQIERERIAAQSADTNKKIMADALHKKVDLEHQTDTHHKDLMLDASKTLMQHGMSEHLAQKPKGE